MAEQGRTPSGAEQVGGIEATVSLDATGLEQDMARVQNQFSAFAKHLDGAAAATARLDAAAERATRKNQAFARSMVEISRGVEDFATGGPLGALNNVPGIFTNMATAAGVSATAIAGWTTGISLAATGAYILYQNWDDLQEAFGRSETLTEAEKMEELAKQTKRTADEQARLNDFKRREKTGEAQDARRPAVEGDIARAVGGEIGEIGADVLRTEITKRILAGRSPITEGEINQELGGLHVLMRPEEREKARKRIQDRRDDAAKAEARKLLEDAETGPGELGEAARRKLGEMLPGPDGDIFRAQTREGRDRAESIALELEGQAGLAAYEKTLQQQRMDAMGVEAGHADEERAMADKNRQAWVKDSLENIADLEVINEMADFETWDDVDPVTKRKRTPADHRADKEFDRAFKDVLSGRLDERLSRINARMADLMAPDIRNSAVFNASNLNASVQSSIDNDLSKSLKVQIETRDLMKKVHTSLETFGKPFQIGMRGG